MLEREANARRLQPHPADEAEWVEAMIQKFSLSSVEISTPRWGFGGLDNRPGAHQAQGRVPQAEKAGAQGEARAGETSEQERKAREEKSQQISTSHGVMVKGQPGQLVPLYSEC